MKHIILYVLLYALPVSLFAQSDSTGRKRFVKIENVQVLGNTKTKEHIILREMALKTGDYLFYDDLSEQIILDQQKIYNLALFHKVKLTPLDLSYDMVIIIVEVEERWYLFPSPILEIVDRNFNDWWKNQNHDLSRINYGAKVYQQNVRGRNETLRLIGQLGYTKRVGLSYKMPYIDKAQKTGMEVHFSYSENNNIAFQTANHLREFIDKDYPIYSGIISGLSFTRRNNFYDEHKVNLVYNQSHVDSSVLELNPNYFGNGESRQQYFSLTYSFRRNKRDVVAYPLRGYLLEAIVRKSGFAIFNDVDTELFFLSYSNYVDLGKNFYLANHTAYYFNSADKIGYGNYYGLGYGKYVVRGYELYVIEGDQFLLNKTSLKKRIFNTTSTISKMPVEQFRHFPFQIYLKAYFDVGYVRNFQNYPLNELYSNKLIYGGGLGLDFVTAYDMVFRTEYSINDTGEHGFFLNIKKEF